MKRIASALVALFLTFGAAAYAADCCTGGACCKSACCKKAKSK